MNPRLDHMQAGERSQDVIPPRSQPPAAPIRSQPSLRPIRWFSGFVATVLWIFLVYGLPLHSLRDARQVARRELTHLLQTNKSDTPAIVASFDQATEEILFAASGPYLILAITTVFLIAQLVSLKRQLNAAERSIQVLRDVVLGIESASPK